MAVVTHSYALGNHVYDFSVQVEGLNRKENVAYQLSFEPDRYEDITTVTLVKLFHTENEFYCPDIRTTITKCFDDFFSKFPDEKVFFETELTYAKNAVKFLKFWRWARVFSDKYRFQFDIVDESQDEKEESIFYAYVTISKI